MPLRKKQTLKINGLLFKYSIENANADANGIFISNILALFKTSIIKKTTKYVAISFLLVIKLNAFLFTKPF